MISSVPWKANDGNDADNREEKPVEGSLSDDGCQRRHRAFPGFGCPLGANRPKNLPAPCGKQIVAHETDKDQAKGIPETQPLFPNGPASGPQEISNDYRSKCGYQRDGLGPTQRLVDFGKRILTKPPIQE